MEEQALTPLHPHYMKSLRTVWSIAAIPVMLVAVAIEAARLAPPGVFLLPTVLALLFAVIRLPLRRYHARGYRMDPDRLRVVRGLLFRSDTVVPFGRVQHIDVRQGPIERTYGLGTLVLHTAGNHNASVSLPGLDHAQALAMRETIRAYAGRDDA